MSRYQQTFQHSIEHPETFWAEQAKRIPWYTPPSTILSFDEQQHARWFSDGEMNLSYAAPDYHVENGRGDQAAIFWDSPAAQAKLTISYREMRDSNTRMEPVQVIAGRLQCHPKTRHSANAESPRPSQPCP